MRHVPSLASLQRIFHPTNTSSAVASELPFLDFLYPSLGKACDSMANFFVPSFLLRPSSSPSAPRSSLSTTRPSRARRRDHFLGALSPCLQRPAPRFIRPYSESSTKHAMPFRQRSGTKKIAGLDISSVGLTKKSFIMKTTYGNGFKN
jgi:hypothetical protein